MAYRGKAAGRRFIVDDFGTLDCYRRCSTCRRWLVLQGNFSPRKRAPDTGLVIRWDAYCRGCRSAATRARYANWSTERRKEIARRRWEQIKGDPERLAYRRKRNAEIQRAAMKRNPDAAKRAYKRWLAKLKTDPERYAAYLERHRLGYRMRAERDGRPVTRKAPGAVNAWREMKGGSSDLSLPAEPFREWLQAVVAREGIKDASFNMPESFRDGWVMRDVSRHLDVDERTIRRILREGQGQVMLATVDRALTRYGQPIRVDGYGPVEFLWDLWPEMAT